MGRELTSHRVSGLNDALTIHVMDEAGHGGACHEYAITFIDPNLGGVERSPISGRHGRDCLISFQNGPIAESGVNGISNEALLAIVRDRLEGFQSGPYACDANKDALLFVVSAMEHLASRTVERVARGVEGTNVV